MPIIPKYGPNTIQFKLKYRTIQAPIQTNTYTIFFILVPGTHTVELGAPAPALTTSTLFYRCGRGIWAFQSVHVLFHCINHILVLVRQFLCVLCQPNFPHLCKIPSADLAEWRCITWLVKVFRLPEGTLCPKNVLVLNGTMKAKIRGS